MHSKETKMKTLRNILIVLVGAALIAGCSEKDSFKTHNGTRIEFCLPGCYDNLITKAPTKASDVLSPEDSIRNLGGAYGTPELISLPAGSTLWLTFSEKQSDGTYSDPDLKAYRIMDNGGYHSMYACTFHDETGADGYTYKVIDEETTGQPLILEDGTYRFKMISPALPICHDAEKGWRLPVDNGMYFYATDGRYHETLPKDIVVDSKNLDNDGNNVQYVKLNPIVNQTARWSFRIFKGENVQSLKMMVAGIEISGLQNPYDTEDGRQEMFYWASDDIRDTLVMKRGDKLQWVKIPAAEIWKENVIGPSGTYEEALCGNVGFLPTNALSTTVVILFNMVVNGIPTQYETTVNRCIFKHAHSYNISAVVDQKDGIRLFNWLNQSWSCDLELCKD